MGMFVVTCAIENARTPANLSPERADLDSESMRRYQFFYPHSPGTPRTVGLSGDMLDLASQTPLGSEHSWRIRTKGSRRHFRYEIDVDQRAGQAELIVDGKTEMLRLPWVPLAEDCESTSGKADELPEKTQQPPSEENDDQPAIEEETTVSFCTFQRILDKT